MDQLDAGGKGTVPTAVQDAPKAVRSVPEVLPEQEPLPDPELLLQPAGGEQGLEGEERRAGAEVGVPGQEAAGRAEGDDILSGGRGRTGGFQVIYINDIR